MAVAKDTLKKQKSRGLSLTIQGLFFIGVGLYGGIMILLKGIGNPPSNPNSVGGILYGYLESLSGQSAEAQFWVKVGFASVFFVFAIIGLFCLIRGGKQLVSARTILGQSLVHQGKNGETLQQTLDSLDHDMEQEPHTFGSIYIGREWILDTEAMRIANIKGIFWWDYAKEDYVLCCVDGDENIWASSQMFQKEREQAFDYLKKLLPDAITGDQNAYVLYLNPDSELPEAQEEAEEPKILSGIPSALPKDTIFTYVGINGIPTSNFTTPEIVTTIGELSATESIVLRPITAQENFVKEIRFVGIDRFQCQVVLCMCKKKEELLLPYPLSLREAQELVEDLLIRKNLSFFQEKQISQ